MTIIEELQNKMTEQKHSDAYQECDEQIKAIMDRAVDFDYGRNGREYGQHKCQLVVDIVRFKRDLVGRIGETVFNPEAELLKVKCDLVTSIINPVFHDQYLEAVTQLDED